MTSKIILSILQKLLIALAIIFIHILSKYTIITHIFFIQKSNLFSIIWDRSSICLRLTAVLTSQQKTQSPLFASKQFLPPLAFHFCCYIFALLDKKGDANIPWYKQMGVRTRNRGGGEVRGGTMAKQIWKLSKHRGSVYFFEG